MQVLGDVARCSEVMVDERDAVHGRYSTKVLSIDTYMYFLCKIKVTLYPGCNVNTF